MRTTRYDDEAVPPRGLYNRIYKRMLDERGEIHCSRCPYHRVENVTRKSPHSNPRKQGRRRRGGVRD